VCVKLPGDCDVAVGVEAIDELVALVAEVGLGGEVGRSLFTVVVAAVAGRGTAISDTAVSISWRQRRCWCFPVLDVLPNFRCGLLYRGSHN